METPEEINKRELMSFYGYSGRLGELRLNLRLMRSWILQFLASNSPSYHFAVTFQRARGVKIGKHAYIGPGVHIDLLYPHLVTIDDYVSIGMCSMIFVHSNPTCSTYLKNHIYPRKVSPVRIKEGAWVAPGTIILDSVTIGTNSVVAAGSVVIRDVKPHTLVAGVPARFIKDLKAISKTEAQKAGYAGPDDDHT